MALVHFLLICFLVFLCGTRALKLGAGQVQDVSATCPESFERHGNRCYKVLESNASWAEAKVYCSVIGGDLAVVEDANENALVLGIISRFHGSKTSLLFWIDGSDMLSENEWRWMGQKGASRLISFTNWHPGQPDNFNNNEHCLEIGDGLWNDDNCDVHRNFICEARDLLGNEEIVG